MNPYRNSVFNSSCIKPLMCPVFFVLFCIVQPFAQTSFAQDAISANSIYINDQIGVRTALDNNWSLFTSQEQAPTSLKPNFPANKGANDSPLFIGIHSNQQIFVRLLAETFFDDLKTYARILSDNLNAEGLEIYSAQITETEDSLALEYGHPQLGLRFIERISLLPDSQVVRMAVWSSELILDSYRPIIRNVFANTELLNPYFADAGWQAIWANVENRLVSGNLAEVSLTEKLSVEPTGEALLCNDPGASMLWQVQSSLPGSLPIFLFGSIHVGKPEFYPLHPTIENIFRQSDYVVFEVDPSSVADPAVIMDIQARGLLPAGRTLHDVLTSETISNFRNLMLKMGLPADNFMGMQPWFLTLMISQLQMNALGYSPQFGLESYFMQELQADTEILELESIQQQISFLQSLNAETYLDYTIRGFEEGKDDIESLISAWQCADSEALSSLLFDDFSDESLSAQAQFDMENLMEQIYTQRNISMAEKIIEFLETGTGQHFVVVGAAHLLGDESIIHHLEEAGYQINPVRLLP